MGINIDLGDGSQGEARGALAPGKYTADLVKFATGQNKAQDKYYVQAVFGNVEGGVDTNDSDFGTRQIRSQRFWLTKNAMWALRSFASNAGVELPRGMVEFEDEEELAEHFLNVFTENSDTFEIEVKEDENNDKYTNVVAIS